VSIRNVLQSLGWRSNYRIYPGLVAAVVAVTAGASVVLALPSSSGLVAHWSFDQSTGTVLNDDSGNGHNGTFASTPTWAAGRLNNALTFNGTDNVALGNITQINGASKATLATWIKRGASGADVFVGKQASRQDFGIEAYSDGKVYFDASNGTNVYGTVSLNDTAWHHVALVFDGAQSGNANRLKAYVDGVQKTLAFSGTVGTTTSSNTTPFNIGKMSGEYSNGQVDDTWLYARALSQAEIQDLMQPTTPPADILAPSVPANVSATAVSQTQINLTWSASTDNVGVTGYRVYRNGVEIATTAGTSYQNTGLSNGTTYAYTVRAYDAAGNQSADSAVASATTPSPDTVAPTVGLTAPMDGATVSGFVDVTATAGDNVAVDHVTFSVDGTQLGSPDASAPYDVPLDTATLANGSHIIRATAYDAAGNSAYSEVTIIVDNQPDTTAPIVNVTAPTDGSTVSGVTNVTATAGDNVAVDHVTFSVDGTQLGSNDTSVPYSASLNTSTLTNGVHTIRATATDTAGNSAYSEVVVTVDNDVTAPTVSVTAPADGSTVSGNVSVTADATDNHNVSGVKFYAGATQIGSESTVAPYSVSWDTTTVANGSIQLTAVARDAVGNMTTSSVVAVTVNNPIQTTKFVSGVSSNGRYFVDQTGAPILVKGDSPWAMFPDLSPAQVEQWATNRESHGFNAAIVSLVGGPGNGANTNGSTYDGILPFNSGNITSFNEAYWTRMDNYLTILKNHGITAFLYPMDGWNTLTGGAFHGKSAADSRTYGQIVANRYASYPNIFWMAGGDYNGFDSTVNSEFTNMLAGIGSTGNNKPFSIQLNNETISTDVSTYEPLANWNFAYTYSTTYEQILKAYNRTPSTRDPRPVLFGEGNYEGEDNYGGPATTNETLRRQQLWTLTSGGAGEFTGSQDWQFNTGWETRLDTVWISQMQKVRNFFSDLNWSQLVPDDKSAVVTAGRGTKITADGYRDVLANDYVTAAQTPDKSQTVVYVPTSLSGAGVARTITLDLSKLPTGFTATWVDPTDATASQVATVDGSGTVTTPAVHSDGTRDWLLVIR